MIAFSEPNSGQRTAYTLLILAAAAMIAGRILAGDAALLGHNDLSRWCTIRSLVDNGTYVIGYRQYSSDGTYHDSGIVAESDWHTVDKVLKPDSHAFFSSKPPLFSTLAAFVYWLLKHTLGWSITSNRLEVTRCTLLIFNCLPLTIYLVLMGRLLEQFVRTDWGRLLLMVAACFGTFLTTFAVVLTNHTFAACFVLFALYQAFDPRNSLQTPIRSRVRFAAAGFFASFAAVVDLPAAAFLAWLGAILLRRSPRLTIGFFIPASLLPVGAFFLTNYLAIEQLRPAYSEFGGPWYTYEGSYWQDGAQQGIDAAGEKETKIEYVFHFLFGHHGLFSLTPVFLLALLGKLPSNNRARELAPRESKSTSPGEATAQNLLGTISVGTWLLTAVVIGFYVLKTSNYGGSTAGPRWLLWLTPFLLLSSVPAADSWSQNRVARWLGYVLLAISIFSVHYSIGLPWQDPWLYRFMKLQGWLPY